VILPSCGAAGTCGLLWRQSPLPREGLGAWPAERVIAPAEVRLYRAVVSRSSSSIPIATSAGRWRSIRSRFPQVPVGDATLPASCREGATSPWAQAAGGATGTGTASYVTDSDTATEAGL